MTDSPFRKTRRAYNLPNHAHLLTYSCRRRAPYLNSDLVRGWVVESMKRTREHLDVALIAYVVMPEHVHLLLFPRRPDYEMRRVLAALKRPVAVHAREWLAENNHREKLDAMTEARGPRRVFTFWQPGGGYDQNLWSADALRHAIEYIHNNPVRRGLVNHPSEWKWSSAGFWMDGRTDPIEMDRIRLG